MIKCKHTSKGQKMNWYQVLVEYDEMIGTIYVAADELEAFKAKYKVLSVII
jgi:hypothetical protein